MAGGCLLVGAQHCHCMLCFCCCVHPPGWLLAPYQDLSPWVIAVQLRMSLTCCSAVCLVFEDAVQLTLGTDTRMLLHGHPNIYCEFFHSCGWV